MRLFLISGEASGDLHGSNLIRAIKDRNENVEIEFWGGDLMEKEIGKSPKRHYKELAFMGFIEVVKNIPQILKNFKQCKADIIHFKADAICLIDYPGFNLRIAKWAKKQGIKVYYYISPKVWAWKESRVHTIIKNVDTLFTIFPFETEFYAKYNYKVEYVGNPLLDAIRNYKKENSTENLFRTSNSISSKPILALLPGSRKQEVRTKLPVMLEVASNYPNYQILIAGAPSLEPEFYEPFLQKVPAKIIFGNTYRILEQSEVALVTSGTATLETALFQVPQVVCYIASPISYAIAKRLIKIKYISLVNLIFNKEVVKELIQQDCNPVKIKSELDRLVPGGDKRDVQLADYKQLIEMLGNGSASEKVAASICS